MYRINRLDTWRSLTSRLQALEKKQEWMTDKIASLTRILGEAFGAMRRAERDYDAILVQGHEWDDDDDIASDWEIDHAWDQVTDTKDTYNDVFQEVGFLRIELKKVTDELAIVWGKLRNPMSDIRREIGR